MREPNLRILVLSAIVTLVIAPVVVGAPRNLAGGLWKSVKLMVK